MTGAEIAAITTASAGGFAGLVSPFIQYGLQNKANALNWAKYNSPLAQRRAYKEAGLSPMLAMSSGAATMPTQTAASPIDLSGLSSLSESLMSAQQNEQTREMNAAQIDLMTSEAKYQRIQTEIAKLELQFTPEQQNFIRLETTARINNIEANTGLIMNETQKAEYEAEILRTKSFFSTLKEIKELDYLDAAVNLANAQISFIGEQISSEQVKRLVMYAQEQNINEDTKLKGFQAKEICSIINVNDKQASLLAQKYFTEKETTRASAASADIAEYNNEMKVAQFYINAVTGGIGSLSDLATNTTQMVSTLGGIYPKRNPVGYGSSTPKPSRFKRGFNFIKGLFKK